MWKATFSGTRAPAPMRTRPPIARTPDEKLTTGTALELITSCGRAVGVRDRRSMTRALLAITNRDVQSALNLILAAQALADARRLEPLVYIINRDRELDEALDALGND